MTIRSDKDPRKESGSAVPYIRLIPADPAEGNPLHGIAAADGVRFAASDEALARVLGLAPLSRAALRAETALGRTDGAFMRLLLIKAPPDGVDLLLSDPQMSVPRGMTAAGALFIDAERARALSEELGGDAVLGEYVYDTYAPRLRALLNGRFIEAEVGTKDGRVERLGPFFSEFEAAGEVLGRFPALWRR